MAYRTGAYRRRKGSRKRRGGYRKKRYSRKSYGRKRYTRRSYGRRKFSGRRWGPKNYGKKKMTKTNWKPNFKNNITILNKPSGGGCGGTYRAFPPMLQMGGSGHAPAAGGGPQGPPVEPQRPVPMDTATPTINNQGQTLAEALAQGARTRYAPGQFGTLDAVPGRRRTFQQMQQQHRPAPVQWGAMPWGAAVGGMVGSRWGLARQGANLGQMFQDYLRTGRRIHVRTTDGPTVEEVHGGEPVAIQDGNTVYGGGDGGDRGRMRLMNGDE